jgi:hypothetical protein
MDISRQSAVDHDFLTPLNTFSVMGGELKAQIQRRKEIFFAAG